MTKIRALQEMVRTWALLPDGDPDASKELWDYLGMSRQELRAWGEHLQANIDRPRLYAFEREEDGRVLLVLALARVFRDEP